MKWDSLELPPILRKLPKLEVTRGRPTSIEASGRTDIAFGVSSIEEVASEARARFMSVKPERPTSSTKLFSRRKSLSEG